MANPSMDVSSFVGKLLEEDDVDLEIGTCSIAKGAGQPPGSPRFQPRAPPGESTLLAAAEVLLKSSKCQGSSRDVLPGRCRATATTGRYMRQGLSRRKPIGMTARQSSWR